MKTMYPPGYHHNGFVATVRHVPKYIYTYKLYILYIHNINIHNKYMHNIDTYIFLLKFVYCSRFCCFTAPVAMQNNDNTLI